MKAKNADIIKQVYYELSLLECNNRYKTSDVRKISIKIYKLIKNEPFETILDICEELLEERSWAMGVIAYDIAFRERKNYTRETFNRFEKWLIKYVRDWSDCDDFCTHAFGALLAEYNDLFEKIVKWCDRPEFWVRRAAPVVLIYPIGKNMYGKIDPFVISNALMNDEHYLVLKGYGWMLKVYGQKKPKELEKYLIENVKNMPRVSFRYAIEKLDFDTKKDLMAK
ncbi:MAG: DNA alkylation repair protein [Alkaliphilus sp.]